MNNTTCASDVMAACDYMLVTTGISNVGWLVIAGLAVVIGAVGLVAAQRLMAEGKRRRKAARAAR